MEIGRTRGGSNAIASTRSRVAAKNPESLVGAILAGINVDEKLGLGLFQRNIKRRKR